MGAIETHFTRGLEAFAVPEAMTLDQHARQHFYLSAESSYVEQAWVPWWFQSPIMCCISNDDIREVDIRKSARVGYTKIIGAAICYFAEHKRRNQIVWQPTDEDRDEWVKTELEPMLRDVKIMDKVFPANLRRHKDNTLHMKKFIGSMLHMKGGKAAKNYRRLSADVGYIDEFSSFDSNIEKEGDPGTLAAKRLEGAIFGKLVVGSTPKLKGFCNLEKRERDADLFMQPAVPCPDCGEFHPITWGGKDEPHGMKWSDGDPDSVMQLCPHCGFHYTQAQYLAIAEARTGRYQAEDGTTLDLEGVFRDPAGNVIKPPERVALYVWSAYSPNVSWAGLVREFLSAYREMQEGKTEKMQAFINTTRGEYWAEAYEATDDNELKRRAEPFALEFCPMGVLLLLASIDVQDNRLECAVWGYGRGCETWTIAHRVFFGNPQEDDVWHELEEYLFETEFAHAAGTRLRIAGAAIDSRGHNTHAVYDFAAKHARHKVFALAGSTGRERHIKNGANKVDINWRGKQRKKGTILWQVGTNLAKDLLYGRLQLARPGPGYIHFSSQLSDEWFKQFTAEIRTSRKTIRGEESCWTPIRKRNEAWDCGVYAVWLETHFDLGKKTEKWWSDLEDKVQPKVGDLFITRDEDTTAPDPTPAPMKVTKVATPSASPRIPQPGGFSATNW